MQSPGISAEERAFLEKFLRDWSDLTEANPLAGFHPHSDPQREFLGAQTRLQAAFAGNRFGKTTSMVVKANLQLCDEDVLPGHLRPYKYAHFSKAGPPTAGRVVVPDLTSTLLGVLLPAFRRWTPRAQLLGGGFDKAYDKVNRVLRYANGSWVQFMTYEMDLDKFGGAALHFVGYDEPPPEDIRKECLARLIDYGGFEMFAMTPLMGIGWVYRDIYKQREAPGITVVRGSIHDNPTLDASAKQDFLRSLGEEDDPERRAREFGDFAHFGGMVYPAGFERALIRDPSPAQLENWDIVVGLDPGLRNAAFVWVAFDGDNRAAVFDEVLLQDKTPADYVRAIMAVNAKWGVKSPLYVIDPAARQRSMTNAESVESELNRLGIYPMHGQNDVQAGVQNIRRRLQFGAFRVAKSCRGLRDEAEEYRVQNTPDGEFKVVKENDHRLDAVRYALMSRAWTPGLLEQDNRLGYRFDGVHAPSHSQLMAMHRPTDAPPLGAMS